MSHHAKAELLRNLTGTADLTMTLWRAVEILSAAGVPSLVVGGYAVQELGWAKSTPEIDLIVPNLDDSLAMLCLHGFTADSKNSVLDSRTGKRICLLPGGVSLRPGPLPLPIPVRVSVEPVIADLRTLIEIKLSSYIADGKGRIWRLRDLVDVVELIKANGLMIDFSVDPTVEAEYRQLWEGLFDSSGLPTYMFPVGQ